MSPKAHFETANGSLSPAIVPQTTREKSPGRDDQDAAALKPRRYIRRPSVLARVPYSVPSLYRLIAEGKFPRPVNMGGRAVAWLESDIDAWMDAREAARDSATATGTDQ